MIQTDDPQADLDRPQRLPLPGTAQVKNSAGGYSFPLDDWDRLGRFLILGTEGGSYYARAAALTAKSAAAVQRCLEADGRRVVDEVLAVSEQGRAHENDPALFVLALAAGAADLETRRAALAALPRVARIGTHLFQFAEYVQGVRGWGRGLKRAVQDWYQTMPVDRLAYQAVKYRQRGGWSHRDLLRLAKPRPVDEAHRALYRWITRDQAEGELPRLVEGFQRAQAAEAPGEVAALVRQYRLPREALPPVALRAPEVWEALLEEMPLTAMIRNLGTMSKVGLVTGGSEAAATVVARLGDRDRMRRARVHPLQVLAALATYRSGHGARGKGAWAPVDAVVGALDAAFYQSFEHVVPSGKSWVLGVDVSGSMGCALGGIPGLTCRDGAAAMSLLTAARERGCQVIAFCDRLVPVDVSPHQRLDEVVQRFSGLPFGGTDCALPMVWALENRVEAEVFVVYTDNETWFGNLHPSVALQRYRDGMGLPAKLIVAGMVANPFTIADPADGGMLDVVGFDTAAPSVMADFARG